LLLILGEEGDLTENGWRRAVGTMTGGILNPL
jgi:hypothetical protein